MRVYLLVACAVLLLSACPAEGDDTSAGSGSTGTTGATASGGDELNYCPGVPEVSAPCLDDDDCDPLMSMYCAPEENDCPGAGCAALCVDDAECGADAVCVVSGTGCCAGQQSLCLPACTPGSCAEGEECLPDGHCAPLPCDGGYTCPAGNTCAPKTEGADGHGCVQIPCDQPGAQPCGELFGCVAGACERLTCTASADCPCGTCVQGRCHERPWLCTSPSP